MDMRNLKRVKRSKWILAIILAKWCIVSPSFGQSDGSSAPAATYGPPRQLAELANKEISESSGLAASRARPGQFWTHNDSGDQPRIFAFNSAGAHLGLVHLRGAEAIDWEDMASFERDGKTWLLLADVGDNGRRRKTYQLYLCEEPSPTASETIAQKIEFQYLQGSHNCESVAVDASQGVALLITKTFGTSCDVYQLAIPAIPAAKLLTAERIGTVPVPIAVAMDVSPDGLRAIVLTYGDGFEFARAPTETWQQAFARSPQRVSMPQRRQGESICYGCDGQSLYLTSEQRPTPLWQVPRASAGASTAHK